MKDMMMVPTGEYENLQSYYKSMVSSNALLDQVGRIGVQEHLILRNKKIPDSIAVKMIKPMALRRRNLTKRLKTGLGSTAGSYGEAAEEPEAEINTPAEALIKHLINKQTPNVKESKSSSKPAKKGKRQRSPSPPLSDDDYDLDGSYLGKKAKAKGKAKGKKAKKAKQTEAQKLSKWTKTKKQLDYADAAQYDPGEGLTDDELAKEEASLMLPDDYYSGEDPFQWEEY